MQPLNKHLLIKPLLIKQAINQVLMLGLSTALVSLSVSAADYITPSDKGGFQYSAPSEFPEIELDLSPITMLVAEQASANCATALAAAPLDLGEAEGFMSKMAGKAANALVGNLVGGLLGGGSSRGKDKPALYKDPIKNKYKEKIAHPHGDARLEVGGQIYEDGILISAKIDKADGKGTFHTMFLERPDCSRIWPEQYLGYDLWGSWSLSVSVTETRSSYRNGELVDSSTSTSGWSKSGEFDFSRNFSLWDELDGEGRQMILNADQAYLNNLKREIGVPAWQQMGYGEPTEGIRSAGGMFKINPRELTNGTIAVIHVTHVDDGHYKTVGFPLRFEVEEEGRLVFSHLETAE